ncbi:MAG: hypothetical protein WCL07_03040 [bacterium]
MAKKIEVEPVLDASSAGVDHAQSDSESENVAAAMTRFLARIKLWAWIAQEEPEAASLLLNQGNVEVAIQEISKGSVSDEALREKTLEALGVKEDFEKRLPTTPLTAIMGKANTTKQAKFAGDVMIDFGGNKKTVEDWIADLAKQTNPDKGLVSSVQLKIQELSDKYGPMELKKVDVVDSGPWTVIEEKIATLKVRAEIMENKIQSDLIKGDPSLTTLSKEISDKSPKRLLQIRRTKLVGSNVERFVDKVREVAVEDLDEVAFGKLGEQELLDRMQAVNWVRSHVVILDDYKLNSSERDRLHATLLSLQMRYEQGLADKMAEQWKGEGKSGEMVALAGEGLRRALWEKKKKLSARIELDGKDDAEKFGNLKKNAESNAKTLETKYAKAGFSPIPPEFAGINPMTGEMDLDSINREVSIGGNMVKALGVGNKYDPYEDPAFEVDLNGGITGIQRIVDRAKPASEENFRRVLSTTIEKKGTLRHQAMELERLISKGDVAAAANLFIAYSTKIGYQETQQDYTYMGVRRRLVEAIVLANSDFAQQFNINQYIGHLPSLTSQKPEEFYATQAKVFAKGNLDILLGKNALMGGNVVSYGEGKEMTVSVKTMKAMMRSHRNQLKILNADVNTDSSTLRGILLEEMYGEGASLVERRVGSGNKELFLALPWQDTKDYRNIKEVQIGMNFAKLDVTGFNGWNQEGHGVNLEQMLDRNEWILKDALQLMWYTEDWMDVVKNFPSASLQNTPKGLLTNASAFADYRSSFELVAPPMLDVVQKLGDLLGPMSRYKSADMVQGFVQATLIAEASKSGISMDSTKASEIGELFKSIHARNTTIDANGESLTFANKLRGREMAKLAFNDLTEDSDQIAELLRQEMKNLGVAADSIPTVTAIQDHYKKRKEYKKSGPHESHGHESQATKDMKYFGNQYEAIWNEVDELKMDRPEIINGKKQKKREIWDAVGEQELLTLWKMNDAVTGRVDRKYPIGAIPLAEAKKMFIKELEIDAFVQLTGTKYGDDWEQFGLKYAPAKMKAMQSLLKIASLSGQVKDFVELNSSLDLFMTPENKVVVNTVLMSAVNRATSGDLLGIDVFGNRPSNPLAVPYEIPKTKKDHNGKNIRGSGSNSIDWITFNDSSGKTHYARTADGTRAVEKEDYKGNWAFQELGIDIWRPKHFEMLLDKLQTEGKIDEHTKHKLAGIVLGERGMIERIVKKWNLSDADTKKWVDRINTPVTWIRMMSLKFFAFDDPQYAFWTLFHDYANFGDKVMENIIGVSVGGGGGHGGGHGGH